MIASLTDPKTKHFDPAPLGTDKLELKGRIDGILNRHPALGLAVGVVRNGRLEFFYSHGVADVASNTPVTQDTVFRIGSITKTFTAIAVLQLWEQAWSISMPPPTTTCAPTSSSPPRPASGRRRCASC